MNGRHESPHGHSSLFRVTSVSYSHPTTPTSKRSLLALDPDRLIERLAAVRNEGIDAFVLSTCLRIEIATVGCEKALGRVLQLLFPNLERPASGEVRHDRQALYHLYRVAAGLESPIIGEPEVLGQFRNALEMSKVHGGVGGLFEKFLESAISAGRNARKGLPDSGAGSIALVAADMAREFDSVSIFGAGTMAHSAVDAIRKHNARADITVFARRPEAVRFPADEIRHLSEAPKALAEAPVVISATSAKRELFGRPELHEALDGRSTELLLIDLAMPPDFEPDADSPNLRYVNLDDLASQTRNSPESEEVRLRLAQISEETWTRLANHNEVGPVIAAILDEARRAVEEEVNRFAGRVRPDEVHVLNQVAQTVAHRVLHRPLAYLSSAAGGAEAAPLLAEVFGVPNGD